ncbi:TFIIB-type zinc ribbon-containing protein [Thalassiella azotivora]
MDLTCPKCRGAMRQYERNAVVVDQCTDCRGVFLDRGELEKLIDAEARWADGVPSAAASAPPPAPQQYQQAPQQQGYQQQDYRQQGYQQQGYRQQPYQQGYRDEYRKKHRRKSFLDELFD